MMLTLSYTPVVYAEEGVVDSGSYIDSASGDLMTIDVLSDSGNGRTRSADTGVYKTRVSRNGVPEEIITVDFENDKITHEYTDGTVLEQVLSDVVTITPVQTDLSSIQEHENPETLELNNANSVVRNSSVDYITYEPFEIDNNTGAQVGIPGVFVYDNYYCLGYRGGYYYAPGIYCYFQRENSGVIATAYAYKFDFRSGTSKAEAASIIYNFYTSTGVGLLIDMIFNLIEAVVELIEYDWSTLFEVRTYKWSYRIRLNSNGGEIMHSNYRTKDYWRVYNMATGAMSFEYRGTAYNGGFLLSNEDMITYAIDLYMGVEY